MTYNQTVEELLREILQRVIRVETRLSKLMMYEGVDPATGQKLVKDLRSNRELND
jgi:hypothetical protein